MAQVIATLAAVIAWANRIARSPGIEINFCKSKTNREVLWFWPKDAYDELPLADHDFIDLNRSVIKEMVRLQLAPRLDDLKAERTAKLLECPYCMRPCVRDTNPEAFAILHSLDPEVVARRTKDATQTMYAALGVPRSLLSLVKR